MKRRTKRTVKEKIISILQSIVAIVVLVSILCLCGYIETHYDRQGKVIQIEENNSVIVEDNCGHIWAFESTDFNVGDNVVMIMHNNYTDNVVTDDIIVNVLKK